MELVTPEIGLIFWTTVVFSLLLVVLKKYAWKPILSAGDFGYKMIKKIFTNKMCQWLFTRLHPNFGLGIAHFWSKISRIANNKNPEQFLGEEKEWLVSYCQEKQKENPVDYYIFGHRHLPLEIEIDTKAKYINLGDWIHHNSYAVFDGENLILKYLN